MAYYAWRVVSGLCLYPDGRQPGLYAKVDFEYSRGLAFHRAVAWRRMEFYHMGAFVCGASGCGEGRRQGVCRQKVHSRVYRREAIFKKEFDRGCGRYFEAWVCGFCNTGELFDFSQ